MNNSSIRILLEFYKSDGYSSSIMALSDGLNMPKYEVGG